METDRAEQVAELVESALERCARARVIYEDAAHQARRDSVKVRAVLPAYVLRADHSHISFMHEGGRL